MTHNSLESSRFSLSRELEPSLAARFGRTIRRAVGLETAVERAIRRQDEQRERLDEETAWAQVTNIFEHRPTHDTSDPPEAA